MTPQTERSRVSFGDFEFDPTTGELLKFGRAVKLQPQPVRVLELLVTRPGELVTREELQQVLWPDGTSVEFDQGLNFCIRQIRAALGESASEPKYLETLPKRGYRFIAPIDTEIAPPAAAPVAAPAAGRRPMRLIAAGLAAIVLISAYWLYVRAGDQPKSFVVRPFETLGITAEQAWYGDALTQQLIGSLVRTKKVKVLPWSTSLALKGQAVSVLELGRRFGVDAILEGSLRLSGDKVRVTVQLVDARSGHTTWTHHVDQETTDFEKIENEVMASIAETLQIQIRQQDTPAARRPPEDRETYNLYLKAVSAAEALRDKSSAEAFEEVTRRAPRFAPAYAGLANVWTVSMKAHGLTRAETLQLAAEAARKAIALDESLAEGHAALAHVYFHHHRWAEAEHEFRIALGLDPDSASTLQIFAIYLAIQGRFEEALQRAEAAARLAPASSLIAYTISTIHFHSGNYNEAIAAARRTLEFDKSSGASYQIMARAYAMKGMHREAKAAFSELVRVSGEPHPLWAAYLLARSGNHAEARAELRKWDQSHPGARYEFPYALALLECGDTNPGFEALGTPEPGSQSVKIWIKQSPELRKWHGDPRFQAIAASIDRPMAD